MSLASIRGSFEQAVSDWCTANNVNLIGDNVAAIPVDKKLYARAFVLPAQPYNINLCSDSVEQGVFQVSIYGLANQGWGAATRLADDLVDNVLTNQKWVGIANIKQKGYISQGLSQPDGRYMVPVSFNYSTI